ncbi:hypothetical protein AB1Y20_010406 [Prymnesium parvum]|uniref:PH domain-containing protein n=1 Tax=Prymnesium parvum TaxID=97485 RepID=A0AB34INJ7_PRYPA
MADRLERRGWVRKKPSSHAKTPWDSAPIQRRYFVSVGNYVEYFHKAPAAGARPPKPNGSFDLRQVTSIRSCAPADPSAPPHAFELIVGGHHLALDFGYLDERNAWLQMWANGLPRGVLPAAWDNAALRGEFAALGLSQKEIKPTEQDDDRPGVAGGGGGAVAAAYAAEAEVMSGELWKEGHRLRTWKRRYFRLTSWGNLKYYEDAHAHRPIDVIPLGGSAIFVPSSRRANFPHAFRLQLDVPHGEKHKYILSAESAEESQEWQRAILHFSPLPSSRDSAPSYARLERNSIALTALMSTLSSRSKPMGPPDPAAVSALPEPPPRLSAALECSRAASSRSADGAMRRVMVLGSTGNVGQATLHWLVQKHSHTCLTIAGTRNPHRVHTSASCIAVAADLNEPNDAWLQGLDVLVVITPGNDDRVGATIRLVDAASAAGVPHLIVVSVITAEVEGTIFGAQFEQIEAAVRATAAKGTKHTLVRLPLFLENYFGFTEGVRKEGKVKCCIDPIQQYSPIAVTDIGEALAAIAADTRGSYLNKTVSLAGEAHSLNQVATWLSDLLRVRVEYEWETNETTRATLLEYGFLQWQAEGIIELYDLVSQGRYMFESTELVEAIGHPPMAVREWLEHVAAAFVATAAPKDSPRKEEDTGGAASEGGECEDGGGCEGDEPAGAQGEGRKRSATAELQENMAEVWNEVFLLESEGRFLEAAEHQAARLVEVKKQYDSRKLS